MEDLSELTGLLLKQAAAGEASAVNELMSLHREYIHRFLRLQFSADLQGRLDVSDIVQETQLEAVKRLDDYLENPVVPFRIWLRQKATEQLINQRRRHAVADCRSVYREQPVEDSAILASRALGCTPSKILRLKELSERIHAEISQMAELDREILHMRHIEELTNQEIASLLGIESDTASQRYGRAMMRLLKRLESLSISDDFLE